MQQLALAYQKDPYRTRHVCHPVVSSCLCKLAKGVLPLWRGAPIPT